MRIEAMWHFLNIAEMHSMAKVAKKLSVPQQSLSSTVLALEDELGVLLLIRERNKLKLTEEGQLFYEYCEQFFRSYRYLRGQLFPEKREIARSQLLISTQNNIAQTIVPRWMGAILRIAPKMKVDVKLQKATETMEDVALGKADVGLILQFEKDGYVWPQIPEGLLFERMFYSKPCFWVNEDCALARYKSLRIKMVSAYPMVKDQSCDLTLFDHIFEDYFGLEFQYVPAINARVMTQLVKENIAVCPDLMVQDGEPALADYFKEANVRLMPISQKDDYRLNTGYIIRKEALDDKELEKMLRLL